MRQFVLETKLPGNLLGDHCLAVKIFITMQNGYIRNLSTHQLSENLSIREVILKFVPETKLPGNLLGDHCLAVRIFY